MKKIVYGTSDWYLNYGEVLLTHWVGEHLGVDGLSFFYYPKGAEWLSWEVGLFEPYDVPEPDLDSDLGLWVELVSIREMLPEGDKLRDFPLKEIVEIIRQYRQNHSFVVANLPPLHIGGVPIRVRASSKDKAYVREFAHKTLGELLEDEKLKLGGALIYFIYGYHLAKCGEEKIGILPAKQKDDVLGAFRAGEEFAGRKAKVVETGEIDFMTAKQWWLWSRDKKWRKAPLWTLKKLLTSPVKEEVKKRLLSGQYCPLVYDEERDEFFFWGEEE